MHLPRAGVLPVPRRISTLPVFEVVLCGLLAAGLSVAVVVFVPVGGDLAAHLYRTSLVRHGILVWDNLWFAGQYPLSAYSLLYYPLAAVVGNAAMGVGSAVLAAALFASITHRQWDAVARWPARLFAVLLVGQVFTAAYPFDAGLAMLLAAIWSLQRRRVWLTALFTLLTLGFSPLAMLFLAVALCGLFVWRHQLTRQSVVVALSGALGVGIQLAVLRLLPTPPLVFPYGTWRVLAGLVVAGLGTIVAVRRGGGRPLAAIFIVWAVASVVAGVVPSPIGRNMARASIFAAPLMLIAASLARWRPRSITIGAVAVALAANVLPYATMVSYRASDVGAQASFWRPVVQYLRRHNPPGFRVEVVATRNHWENYFLPGAGIPLARGWYIQLDVADNAALYRPTLTARSYRAWLRERAVRYVVLPHLAADAGYGGAEPRILASGRSGLRPVWKSRDATVYELPGATPLLTGPAPAAITRLTSTTVEGRVARVGTYRLRIAFNPYWHISGGEICLSADGRTATWLHAEHAGRFALKAIEDPGVLLSTIFVGGSADCR